MLSTGLGSLGNTEKHNTELASRIFFMEEIKYAEEIVGEKYNDRE